MVSDIIMYWNSMTRVSLTTHYRNEGTKQRLGRSLVSSTQEDERKINLKNKLIHIALGKLFYVKICIGSCDYYACPLQWELMELDYLVLHEVQLRC